MNKFTEEQQEKGCRMLVVHDGHIERTREALLLDSIDVAERTLRDWKNSERYEWLAANRDQWYGDHMAELFENHASLALSVATRGLINASQRDDWDDMNIASLGQFIQKLGLEAAVTTDKALLLRGRPTKITESTDLLSALKELRRLGVVKESPLLDAAKDAITVEAEDVDVGGTGPRGESEQPPQGSRMSAADVSDSEETSE